MTNRKPKKFTAFLWHRRIGLFALILVIILAVTGILLNHTEQLELDETYVGNSWLLSWYGIEPKDEPVSYRVGEHVISSWHHQLFFDDAAITTLEQNIHGAIAADQFIVIALDDAIILLTTEGEFIERVSTSISFSNIQRLGIKYMRPVIETSEPLYYIADEHILDWDIMVNEGVRWVERYTLSSDEKEKLLIAYRGNGLKLERVILDLHSGRIFGSYGIYVMDAAAFALLWLSCSGFWVWNSRRHKMRKKKHYQKHHRS
ncbi:MAG: PepSY domain-containing protein [Proteobacteria bacterium]|nr:PepSY domain-containing protein [Pseudomonadota bacterium]